MWGGGCEIGPFGRVNPEPGWGERTSCGQNVVNMCVYKGVGDASDAKKVK